MGADVADTLARLVAEMPELGRVLAAILDRREAAGRLPGRLTVDASPPCAAALRAVFSAAAVTDAGEGRVRLALARVDARLREGGGAGAGGLEAVLYRALGRAPRDPAAEEAALRRALSAELDALAREARSAAARAWARAVAADVAAGRGEVLEMARARGPRDAAEEASLTVRAVDAILENDGPIRLANFAARALGHSKALLPRSERLRRVCAILWEHDRRTRDEVEWDGEPTSLADAHHRALEVHGVVRDEATTSVLLFGPLVYRKEGRTFDHVAAHAALGDVARLTLSQLRGAELVSLAAARVTILENRTPFLDYVDALTAHPPGPPELVVASDGQANWCVITLLRLIARARLGIPVRHSGDLDRAGVLILRSLARRGGLPIEPLAMDAATHRRFRDRALPVRPDERRRLAALLAADPADAPAHELLAEVHATGLWLEQESFFHEAIVPRQDAHPVDP